MIKRTLYFGNPAYLHRRDAQLKVLITKSKEELASIPIEDIAVLILDHPQVVVSHALLQSLIANNVAVISCDDTHHPIGLFLTLDGNSVQSERFKHQIAASESLKKQLWAQTVSAKVYNQAMVLERLDIDAKRLRILAIQVKSGDKENIEARAAKVYWQLLMGKDSNFTRDRHGASPNAQLNYGYAILRASVARALVSSGMMPTLGIFHRNKYNAYCLADDIMEPYRPFVDEIVIKMLNNGEITEGEHSKDNKTKLLSVLTYDVVIANKKSPLMVAISRTTNSLYECFAGERRKIIYPNFHDIPSLKPVS